MKEMYLPTAVNDSIWAIVGPLGTVLLLWLAVINLIAFVLMGLDKSRAKRQGARRIPEKALFLSALLGGSVGAILGMQLFRHKTKHWYFVWGMPLILIAQIALALWLGSL